MSGKEDCNVCLHSIAWYDPEALEKQHSKSVSKVLRAGFVPTPTGMTIYCKFTKKFYPPSHWCKKWRDIKLKR